MSIEKEFQKEVFVVKEHLLSAKKECDANEHLLDGEARIAFVKRMGAKYYKQATQSFVKLTELMSDVDTQTYERNKKFVRDNLYALIAGPETVVNKQICEKPLGYAGDFVVADYFYRDGHSGNSLFAMLMDRYTVESPLARAHINRRNYLGRFIEKLAKRRLLPVLHVTSLACGPAPEVFDVHDKGIRDVSFTLLDGERGVIQLLKERIKQHQIKKEDITLIHENIINLLRKNQQLDISPQDLIYCAGFFDYIRENTATKLIRYMLRHLKPGGWLIVVNVSMDDVKNVYLKMIGEWDLYHRSHKDLLLLASKIDGIGMKKVLRDPKTRRNLYLVIKKKKNDI